MKYNFLFIIFGALLLITAACSTTQPIQQPVEDLEEAFITADSLVSLIPDYSEELLTISGKGRAMISEPGSSERVTIDYYSDRENSLLIVRTSVGIEAANILAGPDSLLIFNKVDNIAEIIPVTGNNLTGVGSIASLNLTNLFNFTFTADDILRIFDDADEYVVLLQSDALVRVSKQTGRVLEVRQPEFSQNAAYSLIEYEGYAEIEDFQLPRKITIFSADGNSRAVFLVQQLEVNKELPPLKLEIPDSVPIYR